MRKLLSIDQYTKTPEECIENIVSLIMKNLYMRSNKNDYALYSASSLKDYFQLIAIYCS